MSMHERSYSVKDWQMSPFFSHINAWTRFLHIIEGLRENTFVN